MRPEIQALRALAVVLVVVFHLWPSRLPGGFIGVDVFFVISGYLITRHLLDEVERTGTVKVFQFWARRLRRLLPASLLVLIVTAAAVMVIVPYAFWDGFLQSIVAAAVYVLNWRLSSSAVDYWNQGAASSPVQHFWSLSVEEQFYFIWPLLIVAVLALVTHVAHGRHRERAIGVLLGTIFLASLAYSIVFTRQSPDQAYFVTPTRAWEFAAGGLLAMAPVLLPTRPGWRSVISWAGFVMILASAVLMSESLPFPGAVALIPVLGTAAMLTAGNPGTRYSPSPLMEPAPVQRIGDWSYSIYLWHWPPIILLPWLLGHALTTIEKFGIIGGTLVLAALTQRYVESPLRNASFLKARRSLPTFGLTAIAMTLVVATGLSGAASAVTRTNADLAAARTAVVDPGPCLGAGAVGDSSCPPEVDPGLLRPSPATARLDLEPRAEPCYSPDDSSEVITCSFGAPTSDVNIALVGDSHGAVMTSPLIEVSEKRGWHLDVYLKTGCPWGTAERIRPDGFLAGAAACGRWQTGVTSRLENGGYSLIVTTGYALLAGLVAPQGGDDAFATTVKTTRALWSEVEAATGTPIAAIVDNPDWDTPSADCLLGTPEPHPAGCRITRDFAFRFPDPQVEASVGLPGVSLIDFSDVYCGNEFCPAQLGGVTVYRDSNHMTRTFAVTLAPRLEAAIAQVLGV